jgi:hypothetical protein
VTEEQDPLEGELDEHGRFVERLNLSKEHADLADSRYRRFVDLILRGLRLDLLRGRQARRVRSLNHGRGPNDRDAAGGRASPRSQRAGQGVIAVDEDVIKALDAFCKTKGAECGAEPARPSSTTPTAQSPKSVRQLIDRGLLFLLHNKDSYGVWYSTQATVNVHDALAGLVAAADGASGGGAAEIFVNGRRTGALDMPPARQFTGPLLFDLTPYVSAGDNRVEVRRAPDAARAQAQAVTTFYVPWSKQPSAANDATNAVGVTTKGRETSQSVEAAMRSGEATTRSGETFDEERRRKQSSSRGLLRPPFGLYQSGGHLQRSGRAHRA